VSLGDGQLDCAGKRVGSANPEFAALFMIDSAVVHPSSAVGGPRLDAVMIVESVVPMLGSERGPLYHLLHLYWF
jgi:hypothetical protein